MDSGIALGTEEDIHSLKNIAILCRIKEQFKVIQKALNDHSIPYQIIDHGSLLKNSLTKSIFDIIYYLINHENKFILNKPGFNNELIKNELETFHINNKSVSETIQEIINKFYKNKIEQNKDEITRLIDISSNFGSSFEKFIQFIILGNGVDAFNPNIESVNLMTLHSSKGLEFECVFIPGCEDRLLPFTLFESQKSDIEEEKRLLYVGMTRAKKLLFMSYAENRSIFGNNFNLNKSPFVDSIIKDLVEESKSKYIRKINDEGPTLF